MSALTDILDAMGAAIEALVTDDPSIQVVARMNLSPQAPTSIDIYPSDPFRGDETTGFGERAGELVFTVRARVTTSDIDAAQEKLLALLDDEHDLCLAAALEADDTLGGLVSQLVVDGDTGYRIFEDPPGAMLGVAWRVRVINATS